MSTAESPIPVISNDTKITVVNDDEPIEKKNLVTVKTTRHTYKYIADIIVESAYESTTHGIPHFFRRQNWLIRIIWAACFLAAAVVCNYLIAQSIFNYFNYNTVTKAQRVHRISSEFPTVSVCNLNPFTTNKSHEFVKSILDQNNLNTPWNTVFESTLKSMKYVVSLSAYSNNLTDSDRKLFGYELKDMLLSCTFSLLPCSVNDFEWYYDMFYGNCYRFNSGKIANGSKVPLLESTNAGITNGLSLELFLYEPDNSYSLASATGARIVVHNKSTLPMFYEGVTVAAGSQTNLQVDRVFSSYLAKPYSDCENNIDENYPSNLVRALLKKGFAYNQETCFLACSQLYAIELCKCYNPYIQSITGTPDENDTENRYCQNLKDISCFGAIYYNVTSYLFDFDCNKLCPLECESIAYHVNSYFANYPSRIYAKELLNNPVIQAKFANNISQLTYESLKANMAQFTVYYGDLSYQQFEEIESMSWIDLISSIGGTLGLFLGMSFLSFVEVLDVILQILFYNRKHQSK